MSLLTLLYCDAAWVAKATWLHPNSLKMLARPGGMCESDGLKVKSKGNEVLRDGDVEKYEI